LRQPWLSVSQNPQAPRSLPPSKACRPKRRPASPNSSAAAKKEGSLTYWDVVIQPETNDALTAAFRKFYGLPNGFQIHYQLSATAPLVTRVEQEINANRVTIDVAAVGSPSWAFERAAAGDALEYDSPQYKFYADVMARGLGRKGIFAFNGAYLFVPMWSTDRTKFEGKSWKDLINAVPAGRISIGDVSKSVAYLATYAGQRNVLDVNYFKAIAAMKPSFLIRSEQVAGRLVTGEDLMAFSGMPTRAYQYNQKGGKLKFMLPEEGAVLLPQSMFILARRRTRMPPSCGSISSCPSRGRRSSSKARPWCRAAAVSKAHCLTMLPASTVSS